MDAAPLDDLGRTLALNGFVILYYRDAVLDRQVSELASAGYATITVDLSAIRDTRTCLTSIGTALSFPDYYGRSLDAFADCLGDVADREYGTPPDAAGTVLVLRRFDHFHSAVPDVAHAVLDIFADTARYAAVHGHLMLCLVQKDDPRLSLPAVGATAVRWNHAESLNRTRIGDDALPGRDGAMA